MENSEQFDVVLLKYIVNEADLPERERVEKWINENEDNREKYQSMAALWQLAAVVDSTQNTDAVNEWNVFKSKHLQSAEGIFFNKTGVGVPLPQATPASRKALILKIIVASAVAASLLLIVKMGKRWFAYDVASSGPTVVSFKPDSVYGHMTKVVNNTAATKMVHLLDGSNVELYSNSEMIYPEPFDKDKRSVRITGKGSFKVSKDTTRPFTVYTNDISTTVLGTRFTITDYAGDETASVQLFEGKVLIKSAKQQKTFAENYYLLPGDQFIYNKQTFEAKLMQQQKRAKTSISLSRDSLGVDSPLFPRHKNGQWYMFNNQPLSEVFVQLHALYGVEIIYTGKDVENIYFIGEFDRNDSLENILREIAIPNGLRVNKHGKKFLVTK